ncbi:MAG: PorV/PorQ family protein [Bacteroidia bacterium]
MFRSLLLFSALLFPMAIFAQLFPQLGAQRAGISALTFLKMEVSPRAAGLASANICLTGDAYSAYTNPAALSETKELQVATANTFWVADINYAYMSVSKPTNIGHFALSLSGLSSGQMPVRTEFQPNGTGEVFYATYMTAGLTYSKQLTDQFSWGVSAKFVQERLAQFTANTGVVDLGFLYRTDFKDLRFAVMIQSFGPNSTLKGTLDRDPTFYPTSINLDDYPAPTVFKLGLSLVPWRNTTGDQSLTTLLQLNHPNDNAENIRFGVEYNYKDILYLRAGYKLNVADQDFPTAGLGVRMRVGRHPLILDYGFDPMRYLGVVHRVGLQFRLNAETR